MDDKNLNSGKEKSKIKDVMLIPAIIQDYKTGEVLMLAYMSPQSLIKSIETGYTWFWSRERQKLWNKGETSGNFQSIKNIYYDCDNDTLLFKVEQTGPACHTGSISCFFNEIQASGKDRNELEDIAYNKLDFNKYQIPIAKKNNDEDASDFLAELYMTIKERILSQSENSYTYKLHLKGLDEIIKKFGEESIEVILAAKHQDNENLVYETADLFYHLTVLLAEKNISYSEIIKELKSRKK
ncbi:MAG: bifunctional phosphoribosyl-AMP cyclohydrolase/phosphoribosyl-ATP diphosphatase HisIE [Candidatus Humimicrobiaceae bacterium]